MEKLKELIDERILVETKDGSMRSGKLTSIDWHTVYIGTSEAIIWPSALTLNDEKSDEISWNIIKKINIIKF